MTAGAGRAILLARWLAPLRKITRPPPNRPGHRKRQRAGALAPVGRWPARQDRLRRARGLSGWVARVRGAPG